MTNEASVAFSSLFYCVTFLQFRPLKAACFSIHLLHSLSVSIDMCIQMEYAIRLIMKCQGEDIFLCGLAAAERGDMNLRGKNSGDRLGLICIHSAIV